MSGFAWVTLATNDSYCLGALVLAHSLKRVGTKHDIAVLITPGVTATMREKLASVFTLVKEVNVLDSQDEANLALLSRPELGITFTKLHCWRLTQYEKCVFVDADTLVTRNCDELFDREELSAAADVGWPDCFNSGVFVFKPSQQTFASLTAFAASKGSFDGGDQGLLNLFFSDWAYKDISKHLPFIYNMCSTASYSYLPAYKQFGGDVRIIHFIGNSKPWLQYFDTQTGQVHPTSELGHLQPLIQLWWDIFCENVHPQLSSTMARSILAQREHKFFPRESSTPSLPNTSHHVCHTSTDKTYDEIDIVPNFSEFKDPWDNYVEQNTNKNANINVQNDDNNDDDDDDVDSVNKNNTNSVDSSTSSTSSSSSSSSSNNPNYPPQNYQVQYCLNENPTCISNSILNCFEHNFSERHANLINNDCNFINENNFESTIDYKRDERLIEDISKCFFDNLECNQLQDNCYEQNYSNKSDQETRINVLNYDNFKYEKESSKDCKLTSFNNTNLNHETNETHEMINYCDNLSINAKIKENELKVNNCRIQIRSNIDGIQSVLKCNGMPLIDIESRSQSCSEFQTIPSQSEMNSTSEVDYNCAGIAGVLARLTLGEARTPEQIVYEEHMRKQSWEQGQIDYMGRDSFDNIWKKICTTLSTTTDEEILQPNEKITPKSEGQEQSSELASDTNISAIEDNPATEAKVQDVITESHIKQTDENIPKEVTSTGSTTADEKLMQSSNEQTQEILFSSTLTSPVSPDANEKKIESISALTSPTPQLCIKEFGEKCTIKTEESTASLETIKQEKNSPCVIPLSFPSMPGSIASMGIGESSASDNPVPIQVAESVLEADIKESVSEDIKPVGEEVVSSISASVQETISAIVETPLEPEPILSQSIETPPSQSNGSASDMDTKSDEKVGMRRASVPLQMTAQPASTTTGSRSLPASGHTLSSEINIELAKAEDVPEASRTAIVQQVQSEVASGAHSESTKEVPEQVPQELPLQRADAEPNISTVSEKVSEYTAPDISKKPAGECTKAEEIKPSVTATAEEMVSACSREEKEKSEKKIKQSIPPHKEEAQACLRKSVEEIKQVKSTTSEEIVSACSREQKEPAKPPRTKELTIPGTPIITEATPPTSPPLDVTKNLTEEPKIMKKPTKKVTKKLSEDKPEGSEVEEGKKNVKKVVRKVVKKPKETSEEGESSNVGEKPKKIVKVVKKGSKTSAQALEANTSVPDTLPPATSDTPMPPKRKVKPATVKSSKKSESEQ